jgi:CheY-like chemotaxis protein
MNGDLTDETGTRGRAAPAGQRPRVLVIDDSPTITKVVQLVLTKAGFDVDSAADGESGLAAVRRARPALILLDFVMPKMNGYQVCRELSADPQLKEIPVILMSAKGDQVGERFVKVMGIVDYITKPFSPEAITAVVQHTVAKYATGAPAASAGDELDTADDHRHGATQTFGYLRDHLAQAIAGRVAALYSLAELAGGDDPGRDDRVPTDPSAIADAARAALDDATLTRILSAADLSSLVDGQPPGLRGDLRVVPVAEVLQLLDAQEQTGVLEVERGTSRVEIYFKRGRVDQALGHGLADEHLLGRFLLDGELVGRAELDAYLESRTGSGQLIGGQLVKLGHLAGTDLAAALARQTSELIYEVLRWRFGQFRFAAGGEPPSHVAQAALGLDVEGILMEGYRRVDEWHLIERAIVDFGLVFLRNEDSVAQMGRGRLTREELAVLEQVNGKNTVKDIVRKSRMGSFEVSKMLYRLLSIGLVRRRVQPVAV